MGISKIASLYDYCLRNNWWMNEYRGHTRVNDDVW